MAKKRLNQTLKRFRRTKNNRRKTKLKKKKKKKKYMKGGAQQCMPIVEQGMPIVEQGMPIAEQSMPIAEQSMPIAYARSASGRGRVPIVEQGETIAHALPGDQLWRRDVTDYSRRDGGVHVTFVSIPWDETTYTIGEARYRLFKMQQTEGGFEYLRTDRFYTHRAVARFGR